MKKSFPFLISFLMICQEESENTPLGRERERERERGVRTGLAGLRLYRHHRLIPDTDISLAAATAIKGTLGETTKREAGEKKRDMALMVEGGEGGRRSQVRLELVGGGPGGEKGGKGEKIEETRGGRQGCQGIQQISVSVRVLGPY